MLTAHTSARPTLFSLKDFFSEGESQIQRFVKDPFLFQLGKGTLPTHIFATYAQQDIAYLNSYIEFVDILAAKAPTKDRHLLLALQEEAISEGDFLKKWLSSQNIPFEHAIARDTSLPDEGAAQHYATYLHRHVTHSFAQGCVALLPCMWVYLRVGDILLKESHADNPYSFWINRYNNNSFSLVLERIVSMTERAVQNASLSFLSCQDIFLRGVELEGRFWQSCYGDSNRACPERQGRV